VNNIPTALPEVSITGIISGQELPFLTRPKRTMECEAG
jgi:hypothetical protein